MIKILEKNIVKIIQITSIIYIIFILMDLIFNLYQGYEKNEETIVIFQIFAGNTGYIVSALFYFGFAVLLSTVQKFIKKD